MIYGAKAQRNRYGQDAVLSATPVQLLTMLYDRLMLDLGRAEAAQLESRWPDAGASLVHAQSIVAELTSSLKPDVWDGAESLRGLYTYVLTALMNANIQRDIERTRECIGLLEPLRQAWHEAATQLPAAAAQTASAARTSAGAGMLGIA